MKFSEAFISNALANENTSVTVDNSGQLSHQHSHIETAVSDTATEATQPSALMNILPLIMVVAVFYLLLIRPQQKKMKEHQKAVHAITSGTKVVTAGGIIGVVKKIKDTTLIVEIAPNVNVEIKKEMISQIQIEGNNTPHSTNNSSVPNDNKTNKSSKNNLVKKDILKKQKK